MVLKAGEMLGPYEIVGTLGQGGMAIVYKGHHPKLDRYVAIKILHNVYLQDPAYVARFEREAQIVAHLEHPHIVPVYDFAEHNGQPYLVMKFIEGRTLKSIVADGPLPQAEIVRIMADLAGALDYAHAQGVLHRDIKPSNILIDRQGVPYLTDFGLARIAEAGESTISKDMLLGTPQYIAPEQAQSGKDVTARTDLYAFGVVLYELMVGRVPFSGDTSYAILHDQIYTPPTAPNALNPALSADVSAVLLKALAKNPTDRYASAREMIAALTDALGSAPHSAAPNENLTPAPSAPAPASAGRTPLAAATEPVPNFTFDFDGAKHRSTAQRATAKPAVRERRWLLVGLALLAALLVIVVIAASGALRPTQPPVTQKSPSGAASAPTASSTADVTSTAVMLLEVPKLSLTQAQKNAAARPNDLAARLAVARALWNAGQVEQARTTLDNGAQVARGAGSSVAAYYLSAAAAAQQDGSPQAAAYADLRALDSAAKTDADYAAVRAMAGQDLYKMTRAAGTLSAADLRRMTDAIGTVSPMATVMTIRALITDARLPLAQAAVERLTPQQSTLAEAHLVMGDFYAARGSSARAKEEWKAARQAPDAPDWVVEQAVSSLSST